MPPLFRNVRNTARAATIHKAQGSEYPAVVILVATQHYPMLQRNLLYTGITWAKRLMVPVGQKRAVAVAVAVNGTGVCGECDIYCPLGCAF